LFYVTFETPHYPAGLKQGVFHGHTLFQKLIYVPFIITSFYSTGEFSGCWKTSTVDDYVQLLDLAPTVLDLTGLNVKEALTVSVSHP
jgi:arylsulfatase A-like enzyme